MLGKKALALAIGAGLSSIASAQQVSYTFTSIPNPNHDGFAWPASPTGVLPDNSFTTPDDIVFYNYTTNALYFDDNYQAAGNSGVVDGDAMWANPKFDAGLNSPYLDIDLYDFNRDGVGDVIDAANQVAFDFSWAIAGQHAPTTLYIDAWDTDGDYEQFSAPLNGTFNAGGAFGGFNGHSGNVSLTPFGSLDNIDYLSLNLADIETGNGTSEFAIDNFNVYTPSNSGGGGGGGTGAENSNITPGDGSGTVIGYSTNHLRGAGTGGLGIDVYNGGTDPTTFSFVVHAGTPGLNDAGNHDNIAIGPGQYISYVNAVSIDHSLASGTYAASATVVNDLNPNDQDDDVSLTYYLYDAPQLTDDTNVVADAASNNGIFIQNATAPSGGLRAGVKVTSALISGSGFSQAGIDVGDWVGPGDELDGTIGFDPSGKISGTYNGTLIVALTMNSSSSPNAYLNGALPVDNRVWNLTYNVVDVPNDSSPIEVGGAFHGSINNSSTAAAIVGGTSSSSQTVSLSFATGLPEDNIVGSPVDVSFENDGDLYVLQLSYLDSDLPAGLNEEDLRIKYYDDNLGQWIDAILANSDGGAGGEFHLGAYEGSQFVLSHFGVDTVNNQIWAVLDHNTPFAVGVPEPASASSLALLSLGIAGMLRRRRRHG